jgi:hypothetical protein
MNSEATGQASKESALPVSSRIAQLRSDLASGAWEHKHGKLMARGGLDIGYRLITAELD